MSRPTYLYVFGDLGGPFKVGYSNNPNQRAKTIRRMHPGRYFAGDGAIMWCEIALPNQADAKNAERSAHAELRRYGVKAPDAVYGCYRDIRGTTEWFDITLGHATKVAFRAVMKTLKDSP